MTTTTSSATVVARRCWPSSPPTASTWPRSRRSTTTRCRHPSASSATSRCTTSGALDLRDGRAAHLGAPLAGARHGRRRPVPAVRPRPRPARRAARCDRRPAGGSAALPRGSADALDGAAGAAVAGHRDRDGRPDAGPVRRARGGRATACVGPAEQRRLERAAERGQAWRSSCTRTWLEGTLADGTDDWPTRPRAPRRAGRACARSTGSTADAILELG